MFGDIGQGFTEYAEHGGCRIRVDFRVLSRRIEPAGNTHAIGKLACQPFDGRSQAEVQHARAQVTGNARSGVYGFIDQGINLADFGG